jgi:site-specific recombinase XerD
MKSAKMTFVLKDQKSLTETLIYCVIRIGDDRMKYSTNEKINPLQWDKMTRRAVIAGTKEQQNKLSGLNLTLNRYFSHFEKIETQRIKLGEPATLSYYRDEFEKEFKTAGKTPKQSGLMQFIDEFIKTTTWKPGTISSYKTTQKALKDFQTPSRKLDFDKITLEFKDKFINDLKTKNTAVNTIHKHIKNIKVFMENAFQRSLHTNLDYKKKLFRAETEETFSIIMTEAELEIMFNKEIQNNKLAKIRDIFIFNCRTGLRYSDLKNFSSYNVIENGTRIRLITIKTGDEVVIPLHYQAQEILKKHDGNIPHVPSNVKYNLYLKDLGELLEFNEQTLVKTKKDKFIVDTFVPKWKLITAHTARRTFATLAFISGMPVLNIRKLTGHRTEKAFLTYIKMSNKENADMIQDHKFFTGKTTTANEAI